MTRIVKETKRDGSTQYLARPIIDGTKHAVRAQTKRELERKIAAMKENADRRRRGLPPLEEPMPVLTFGELCEKVLEQYPHAEQSKRTLRYNLRYARDSFERLKLHELRPDRIAEWNASLAVSATTRRNALKAMRQVLTLAVEWHYLAENPARTRAVTTPEAEERKRPFADWSEVESVAASFDTEAHRALVLFACATGLRPQEWRALRWSDIDRPKRVLRVRRTVQNGKVAEKAKTRGSFRQVLLGRRALAALDLLPTPLDRERLVFPGARGGVLDLHAFRRGPWRRVLERAGVAYREPYQMRHTFATLTLADGAPIEYVSRQLGHASIAVTVRHYAADRPETNYAILDALDARTAQTGLKPDSAASAGGSFS